MIVLRITIALLVSSWACTSVARVPASVLEAQQHRIDVIEKVSKSTLAVFGVGNVGGGGSAVVISPDGYALTNFHVTRPVGNHLRCGMNDGEFYDAVIVGVDPTGDVALIKLLGRADFPAAEFGDSDDMRAGDWCIVSGNPFLLGTDFHPTVTYGIISGVHRYQYPSGTLLEYADCIQTDAAINPGNSGGPLWNAEGQLIGINGRGSFEKRGRVNVGVGYAISINQIQNFMGYLRSGRIVDHATLGATVSTDEDGQVVVTNILDSSDAYRRGLRYGDEIVSFGGRSITSTNGFKNSLGIFPKGWRVPLSFRRDGQRFNKLVRLAGVHRREELIGKLQLGGIALPEPRQRPRNDKEGKEKPEFPIPSLKKAKKKLDPKIAKVFEERRGYSNYYFNKLAQDRIWNKLKSHSDFTSAGSIWTMVADLDNDVTLQFKLGDRVAGGRINKLLEEVDFESGLTDQLAPRNSGGLLLALHQWRRFLVLGPEKFGDVYYLGTAPLPDREGLTEVLVATYDVLETRFYFDSTNGRLVALELYPDSDVDACELYFRDYESIDGRLIPSTINIVFGDQRFDTIRVNAIKTGTAPKGDVR